MRAGHVGYRCVVFRSAATATALMALGASAALATAEPAYDVGSTPAPEAPGVPAAPPPAATPAQPKVAPPSPVRRPTARRSWAGRLLVVATARANPGPGGKPLRLLQPIAPLGAGPVWLQVRDVKVVAGVRWVKVLMPVRPNGSTGWVRASDMVFRPINLRIDVDLSEHRLTLFRKGKKVRSYRIATGTPKNPTPTGRFAIAEVIPTGDPKAFLGPIVMPITGFSETLNEFAGGNGRVAIHGTSLPGLIGTRASHGCIRMRNADIRHLNRWVRGGTPVNIRR